MIRVTVFALFISLFAHGQQAMMQTFGLSDGLPQSQVNALCEDDLGYLWIGTNGGGLARFDGGIFVNFTERNGLKSTSILCLVKDKKRLLVGTKNGLHTLEGSQLNQIVPTNGLSIYSICFYNKVWWLGTNKGIRIWNEKTNQLSNPTPSLNKHNCYSLLVNDGELLIGTDIGLFAFSDRQLQNIGATNKYMRNSIPCMYKNNTTIWFGTYGDGAYYCSGSVHTTSNFKRIDLKQELYRTSVNAFLTDHNGTTWIATTSKGLGKVIGKQVQFLSDKNGLKSLHIKCLLEDRQHQLWSGTSGGGLAHLLSRRFQHFTYKNGLSGNFISAVAKDASGTLYVGTGSNGLNTYKNGYFFPETTFENTKIKALAAYDDQLIVATESKGMWRGNNGSYSFIPHSQQIVVRSMEMGPDQLLYMATAQDGIWMLNKKGIQPFKSDKVGIRALQLYLGKLYYINDRNQLFQLDLASKKQRLIDFPILKQAELHCLEMMDGELFVGTKNNGVIQLSCSPYSIELNHHFSNQSGLLSNTVFSLKANLNELVVGTERGISIIVNNGVRSYTRKDGFEGVETTTNGMYCDEEGVLWIGTVNGLTSYLANRHQPVLRVHRPFITGIALHYVPLLHPENSIYSEKDAANNYNIVIPYDQNHLSLTIDAVHLNQTNSLQFSWKMSGLEDRWSPWSYSKQLVYPNLPSGNYTLVVRSKNEDGKITTEPLIIRISVIAPFYQRWWFLSAIILMVGFGLWKSFQWYKQRTQAKLQERERQLSLENELLELEQQALRLQMNPHFIFNALNSIQSLIGTNEEEKARYYLAKFARLMRQTLDYSRKSSISLEQELQSLDNYILIEQLAGSKSFSYSVELDPNLEAAFISVPPLLLQPFVENAIIHGFKGEAPPNGWQISIRIRETNNVLIIEISDNGIGRKAAQAQQTASLHKHESHGLQVTQQRLALLPGKGRFEVKDLENPIGTQIIIFIPQQTI